jgi:hypothetical protein
VLRQGQVITLPIPMWQPNYLVPKDLLSSPPSTTHIQQHSLTTSTATTTTTTTTLSLGKPPSYLIIGGLVFLPLTQEYLQSEFDIKHMDHFIDYTEEFSLLSSVGKYRTLPNEEIVLLSQVLSHSCNVGYEMFRNLRLKSLNQQLIMNMQTLKKVIEELYTTSTTTTPYLIFEFDNGVKLVLNTQEVQQAEKQVKLLEKAILRLSL